MMKASWRNATNPRWLEEPIEVTTMEIRLSGVSNDGRLRRKPIDAVQFGLWKALMAIDSEDD